MWLTEISIKIIIATIKPLELLTSFFFNDSTRIFDNLPHVGRPPYLHT